MTINSPLSFYMPVQMDADTEVRQLLSYAARRAGVTLRKEMGKSSFSSRTRAQQLAVARGALRETQLQLWSGVSDSTRRHIAQTSIAADKAQTWLDKNIASGAGTDYRELAAQRKKDLQALAEQLVKRGTDGKSLSSKVFKARDLDSGRVLRVVNAGILAGKSAGEIAGDVEKYIKPTTPGGSSYAAMRLARTELQNSFHASQIAALESSPGVIGAKWQLSGSHPEPDECNEFAEDNKFELGQGVFPVEKIPLKPHPQCLCYMIPVNTDKATFLAEMRAEVERLRAQ